MSEIYSPGSVAGPQGPAGAPGAAGSQGSVTALAGSVLPAPINLFNYAAAQENYVTNSDGTIGSHAPGSIGGGPPWITNLLYCPGATQLVCNSTLAVDGFDPGAWVQLFDANGTFTGTLAAFDNYQVAPGTVILLPGTQVYVRLTIAGGLSSGLGIAETMICAGTSASPAAIPGTFASFAPYVSSVVDTNIAAALAVAKAYGIDTGAAISSYVIPANSNRFDPSAATMATGCMSDGTLAATTYDSSAVCASGFVYCPGATAFICNAQVMVDTYISGGVGCQLFDAAKNFLGTAPVPVPAGGGDRLNAFTSIALPGTQTFLRFCFDTAGGTYQGASPANTMVFAGASGSLAALGSTTPFVRFGGSPLLNEWARTTVRKASELGCHLNSNVLTGGGDDDSALIQAFLDTASATNPIKLILDGAALLGAGLVVGSNTAIEGTGWGSGLYLANGVNQNVITAGATGSAPFNYSASGDYNITLPSRATSNIVLRDFTVNGNGNNQSGECVASLFVNATEILLDRMNYPQAAYFAAAFSNCAEIAVRGCSFTSGGYLHDGVHLDGPVEDVLISDCVFATGDDAIAVNCPEGYGGDISRVVVTNCIFDNSLTLMRVYTSLQTSDMPTNNVHTARQIAVSNCVGRVQACVFSLGVNGPGIESVTNVDQIEDVLIENCDIEADTSVGGNGWLLVSDAIGLLQARGCTMRSPQSTGPFVVFTGVAQAGQIALTDITILRNGDGNSTPALFDGTNAISVGKLTVRGCKVVDEAGSSYAAIANALVLSTPLAELVIDSLEMDHFTALAASFANVTVARGAGLLGTGAQFADATMDNNALYLSSNDSGAPSIKIGGTAKRFTLA